MGKAAGEQECLMVAKTPLTLVPIGPNPSLLNLFMILWLASAINSQHFAFT
jgi:hypothetical protein